MGGASKRRQFAVQLVLEDLAGRLLRRSRRHGELAISPEEQWAMMVYPRHSRFYSRKFDQPLKCVVGRRVLRVYSSNGKRSFMCRMLSESDIVKAAELLQDLGADVIWMREPALWTTITPSTDVERVRNHALLKDCDAALRAIQEPNNTDAVRAFMKAYAGSEQQREDARCIVRALFSG